MEDQTRIRRFCRRLSRLHRLWQAALAALGHALLAGVIVLLIELVAPQALFWAVVAGLSWVVVATAWISVRHRPPVEQWDRDFGLRDRLLTYLGMSRGSDSPFATWLEQDLDGRLATLPEERTAAVLRRPLGPLRYLLPVLVLLLMLRSFAPLPLHPDDSGPPMASNEGDGDRGGGGDRPDGSPQPRPGPAEGPGDVPEPPPPPPEDSQSEEVPPEEQPEVGGVPEPPVEDVQAVDEAALPSFVGDGETRRELAKLALIGDEPGGGGATTPETSGGEAPLPGAAPPDYQKALEQALRARHVPPSERPFVRAYFEALLEVAR